MKLLAFGDAVAQVEGFLQVISAQAGLAQIGVIGSQTVVRHRKVGVEFDGALVEWNGFAIPFSCRFFDPGCKP